MHTPNPSACLTHSNLYSHNPKIHTRITKPHLSTRELSRKAMMVNPKHRVRYFLPPNSQRSSPPAAPPLDHKPPTKKAHQNAVSPTPPQLVY